MADKLKYPVRYVALGLRKKEKVHNLTQQEEYYGDVYAYAVVKAWVINEIKTNNLDGGFSMSYDVVPEWTQEVDNNEPKFNMYGRCYNTINLTNEMVFHNADQAKAYCKKLNDSIMSKALVAYSGELLGEKKKQYKEVLSKVEAKEQEYLKANIVNKR